MDKEKIVVPLLEWLIGGSRIGGGYNIYTGSIGTDPYLGCLNRKMVNYRIWIEKTEDDKEMIMASVYSSMKQFALIADDEKQQKAFELDESSREEIRTWISEEIEKL